MACNTAYYFLPELLPRIGLPVIDMIEEAAKSVRESGCQRVGLLATAGTCRTGLYQEACAREKVELLRPSASGQEAIQDMIYAGVKAGKENFDTTAVQSALDDMLSRGAEAFILGCTETPLAVEKYRLEGRFIDATQVLAEKAVERVGGRLRR